ncbi:MAG: hypothetical protein SGILL_000619 [Bacillariaceae sp.]
MNSFRKASRNLNVDSDGDDDDMSTMASPTKLYSKEKQSRGRSTEVAGEGGRSSSRSRSRSSSVLRKILGGGKKEKKADDGMSVASGMSMSMRSIDTKSTKIKRIKKIKKLNDDKSVGSKASLRDDDTLPEDERSRKRSSSKDRARPKRSNSTDRARPKRSSSSDSRRPKRSSSTDRARPKRSSSTDRHRPKRSSSTDRVRSKSMRDQPIAIDEDLSEGSFRDSPLSKKMNKKRSKSRDSRSVLSDGNYGADEWDGDNGSIDGRSVDSEGILSPRSRKVRGKRKPKKSSFDDDGTVGSRVSLADSTGDYSCKTPKASSSRRIMHEDKVASISEPPLSPDGANILDAMDNLLPSPEAGKKKLPRVKRKGSRPDPPLPPSGAKDRNCSPIVDRTPGARPSDYRNGTEAAAAVLSRMSRSGHDSGLSVDSIPKEVPTSNRSSRSLRNSVRNLADNDTESMTDTVSSLHKHLEDQREETKDLRKQLTEALTKIASLNEELRRGETFSLNEKAELLKSINDMREDSIAKDDRIDKLQSVVETQLDTIEFLEEKLEQTEDELLKVEDELKDLDDGGLLDKSVHTKDLLKRKGSIRQEKVTRKGSIQARNEQSRSILRSDGTSTKRSREDSYTDDFDEREAKVIARELRLDEWEKNLVKFDVQIKNSSKNGEEEAAFQAKLQLMEKRERRMEENRDALVQEKDALATKIQRLESSATNMPLSIAEESPMDEDTNALKRSISELESENKNLLIEVADLEKGKKDDDTTIAELENVKQDLLVKLDHVRATAIRDEEKHQEEVSSLQDELKLYQDAEDGDGPGIGDMVRVLKEDISEKETTIQELGEKLKNTAANEVGGDDEGKDMLIIELQNQLVAAKKEASGYSSGDYVKRLKNEIKTLKHSYNELKKRMKRMEVDAQAELKRKDEALKSIHREMEKHKRERERLEKREKNLGTGGSVEEEGLKKHIEDLEDEIDHWKATNADLEHELDLLKSEFSEWKRGREDGDDDDDLSVGSLMSLNSHMSESASELFFVSDSSSMRSNRSISVGIPPPPGEEPSTPSQRAMRSVSNLWSKMKTEPGGAPPPAISAPYGAGMLDDD